MSRRIVQIAAAPGIGGYDHRLYALDERGDAWLLTDPDQTSTYHGWIRLPSLPIVDKDGAA